MECNTHASMLKLMLFCCVHRDIGPTCACACAIMFDFCNNHAVLKIIIIIIIILWYYSKLCARVLFIKWDDTGKLFKPLQLSGCLHAVTITSNGVNNVEKFSEPGVHVCMHLVLVDPFSQTAVQFRLCTTSGMSWPTVQQW